MSDELWQEEARKVGGEHFTRIIKEIRDGQEIILTRLEDMDKRVTTSAANIVILQSAFPAGDIDGHRRYHQLIIDNTEAKRELTRAIKEKTISGLVWSSVVWVASEAWSHLPKLFER